MLRIGIVAGEVSGDMLAAGLINELNLQVKDLSVEGIGGDMLIKTGMNVLYPMEKLSVMGITEVLGRYLELRAIRNTLLDYFLQNPPDVFIGVDAPDFNLWLEKQLKKAGIKTVHYVSPSVWAWKECRIKKIRESVDLILNLFPFESEIYDKYQVPNKYVGHSLADKLSNVSDPKITRQELGLPEQKKIVALLPGSRVSELNKIARPLLLAARLAQKTSQDLYFVSSLANEKTFELFKEIKEKLVPDMQLDIYLDKTHAVMKAADIIMLASGTATLEAMLLQKPMIVTYRLSLITYFIVKLLAKIPYVSLPNILAGKKLVPECLQFDCTAEKLCNELNQLLVSQEKTETMKQELGKLSAGLRMNADKQAAQAVLDLIGEKNIA